MKQEFNLGETVYQITYCPIYSDKGYGYRQTYINKISTIQELGREDKIEYQTALEDNAGAYMTYLDIVKTKEQAEQKLKELQNER